MRKRNVIFYIFGVGCCSFLIPDELQVEREKKKIFGTSKWIQLGKDTNRVQLSSTGSGGRHVSHF
jgi:hypothetical protein